MGYYMMYYMTGFIMVPVFIFALICQSSVKKNFRRYSQVISRSGMTGADAAWRLLQLNGINDVKIKKLPALLQTIMTQEPKRFALAKMYSTLVQLLQSV